VALLEREGGQWLSGLAAACSNSTWMAFGHYSEQCGAGLRLGAAARAVHLAGKQADDHTSATMPLCFSKRQHEMSFDGMWVEHTSPAPSSDFWEQCPAMMSQGKFQHNNQKYLCGVQHPDKQQAQTKGRPLDQDFVPYGCSLPAFDAGDFLRVVGMNQTLWFVGDSMSFQTFISTACLVAQTGVLEVDMPPDIAQFVDEPGCMSTNYKTQCILVAGGVRICYLCKFRADVDPLYELMTTIGSSPSTTIVFNFGVRPRHPLPPQECGVHSYRHRSVTRCCC
jgi:hypothetical protein